MRWILLCAALFAGGCHRGAPSTTVYGSYDQVGGGEAYEGYAGPVDILEPRESREPAPPPDAPGAGWGYVNSGTSASR